MWPIRLLPCFAIVGSGDRNQMGSLIYRSDFRGMVAHCIKFEG